MPYFAVLLSEAGLPDAWVALALATVPIGVLIGGPLWSWIADSTGSPIRVLRIATGCSVLAGGLLALSRSGVAMAALLLMWSLLRAPHLPLADGLTLRLLGGDRRSYGRIRAVGSSAFLVVAWTGGWLREAWPPAPLWLSFALLCTSALLAWTLPDGPTVVQRARTAEILALVRQQLPFLAVAVLHGIGLVCFDSFWSLHVERLGLPSWIAGTGVALAVAVEVGVMIAGRRLLDRFGPTALIGVAIAVAIPQWWLTATVQDPTSLVAIQALRGVAFGAFWIAGVAWLSERSPSQLGTSAQALLPASAFGVGYLLCTGLAAVVLDRADTAALFRIVAGSEFAAAVVFAAAAFGARRRAR